MENNNDPRVKMYNGILKAIHRYYTNLAIKRSIILRWAVEHDYCKSYDAVPESEDFLFWSEVISNDFDNFMKWFRMNYDPTYKS